jgi:hypothetical protein
LIKTSNSTNSHAGFKLLSIGNPYALGAVLLNREYLLADGECLLARKEVHHDLPGQASTVIIPIPKRFDLYDGRARFNAWTAACKR